MIGSLLFYVLSPISRYLASRHTEFTKKNLPPAVVNGTAVWDGGAVPSGRFTPSQTALLDQWLSPSDRAKGEAKERMKEPNLVMEDNTRPDMDKEQMMAVLPVEGKTESASQMGEMQLTVKENQADTTNGWQQLKDDGLKEEDRTIHHELCHIKKNIENANIFPSEDSNVEQKPVAQQESLQLEDSTQVTTCLLQQRAQMQNLVTPHELSIQDITDSVHEDAQVKPTIEESMNHTKTAEEFECWDEYITPITDEMHGGENSELLLATLLSDTETSLNLSSEHVTEPGWHFPVGPGLSEEVKCPMWQYPMMSYYPPSELTEPFEVVWRVWEVVDVNAFADDPALMPFPFTQHSMDFSVMSYNILADDLLEANQDLYMHCPLEVLDWSYRCNLLLEEILKWTPDILCLQEVQENHYYQQLHPVLCQRGYTCVYKRRTGTKTDGCAICYQSSCFSEVSVSLLEFYRPEVELLDRHNVGIVLLLRPVLHQESKVKAVGPPLCVANTHLLFNPRRGDVKLAQLAIMLAEIDKVVKSCKAEGEHCNVILCGDFNSLPHMPLYQLITTGSLYYQGLPAWMVSGQEDLSYKTYCQRLYAPLWPSCLEITDNCQYTTVKQKSESPSQKPVGKCQYSHDFLLQLRFCPAACVRPLDLMMIPGVTDNSPDASGGYNPFDKRFRQIITHQLDLESVYKHILPGSGSPEVTTLHSEAGATVDYIFYSPQRQEVGCDFAKEGLKLLSSLSLLSEDSLWSMKGLPNHIFPSDHLSLLAKFQLDLNVA